MKIKYAIILMCAYVILMLFLFYKNNQLHESNVNKSDYSDVKVNIDYCNSRMGVIDIKGWAYILKNTNPIKMIATIKINNKSLRIPLVRLERKDVSEYFSLQTGNHMHGFHAAGINLGINKNANFNLIIQDDNGKYHDGGSYECK